MPHSRSSAPPVGHWRPPWGPPTLLPPHLSKTLILGGFLQWTPLFWEGAATISVD